MNTTPDTVTFMIAGYAAFTVVMLTYIATLILRHQRLRRDLNSLEELDKK